MRELGCFKVHFIERFNPRLDHLTEKTSAFLEHDVYQLHTQFLPPAHSSTPVSGNSERHQVRYSIQGLVSYQEVFVSPVSSTSIVLVASVHRQKNFTHCRKGRILNNPDLRQCLSSFKDSESCLQSVSLQYRPLAFFPMSGKQPHPSGFAHFLYLLFWGWGSTPNLFLFFLDTSTYWWK